MTQPYRIIDLSPFAGSLTGDELIEISQGGAGSFKATAAAIAATARIAYYVSPTGNDGNDGNSPSQAWKTVAKVNASTFAPGTSILFQGGQTFSGALICPSSGVAGQPITFGAYGSGQATISSGTSNGFTAISKGYITVRDLIFSGTSSTNHGIALDIQDGNEYFGISLIDCSISGYGNSGIHIDTTNGVAFSNVFIDSCTVTNCSTHASGLGSAGIWVIFAVNTIIQNCITHDNPGCTDTGNTGNGIKLSSVINAVVFKCLSYNNGASAVTSGGGPTGIWCVGSTNVTISNCESHHNNTGNNSDGCGFDIDGGCVDCIIRDCYSHDNFGAGYLMFAFAGTAQAWDKNALINCTSINDGTGGALNSDLGVIAIERDAIGTSMTNASVIGCTAYLKTNSTAVLVLNSLGSDTNFSGQIINNTFAANNAQALINTISTAGNFTINGNNYRILDFSAFWNGVHYTTVQTLQTAASNFEPQGGSALPFLETNSVIVEASKPLLDLIDSQANGGDWFLSGTTISAHPYFVLYENKSSKTEWASNFDNAGGFQLRSGAAFTWSSDPSFADGAAADTGLSRTAAATIAVGNGTSGNATGTLKAATAIFATSSAGITINDTQTNGGDWVVGGEVNATHPVFFLFESHSGRTEWATNFDGAGGFQLGSGGTFAWSSNLNADGAAADTGLTRIAPVASIPTIAIGNGTGGDASGTIKAKTKAGAPANTDVPAGTWALIRDTTNNTTKLYYNNAGTLQTVTLT